MGRKNAEKFREGFEKLLNISNIIIYKYVFQEGGRQN